MSELMSYNHFVISVLQFAAMLLQLFTFQMKQMIEMSHHHDEVSHHKLSKMLHNSLIKANVWTKSWGNHLFELLNTLSRVK